MFRARKNDKTIIILEYAYDEMKKKKERNRERERGTKEKKNHKAGPFISRNNMQNNPLLKGWFYLF